MPIYIYIYIYVNTSSSEIFQDYPGAGYLRLRGGWNQGILPTFQVPSFIRKMVVPLKWYPYTSTPYIPDIYDGYLLGPNHLFKGLLGVGVKQQGALHPKGSAVLPYDKKNMSQAFFVFNCGHFWVLVVGDIYWTNFIRSDQILES